MRRRRSEFAAALALGALLLCVVSEGLHAQVEGAGPLELVFPFGARAVGMGQAVIAVPIGTDAIWWNPGGLATLRRSEVVLQHLTRQDLYQANGFTVAVPRPPVGVVAISAQLVDYGQQDVTDSTNVLTGHSSLRFLTGVATFATTFGARVAAGVSYKVFQRRSDCSGFCPGNSGNSAVSYAVDAGVQYRISDSLPLTIGAVVRNLGLRLQQKDEAQADLIPTRLHIGASYAPRLPVTMKGAELTASAEVVRSPNFDETGVRVGAEVGWLGQFFGRAGYSHGAGPSGGSVGLGFVSGRIKIDLARSLGSQNETLGGAPTLLSLRVGL